MKVMITITKVSLRLLSTEKQIILLLVFILDQDITLKLLNITLPGCLRSLINIQVMFWSQEEITTITKYAQKLLNSAVHLQRLQFFYQTILHKYFDYKKIVSVL